MLHKVVVLTGPTGVGKTSLSIKLAKIFNAEIINCDASQVYKYLNIGTAKITYDEMDGVKHHLIDILEPDKDFSIKDYQNLARNKIDEIISSAKVPFMVGGSGLYIKATLTDYRLNGPSRDEDFEKQFDSLSNEELHYLLYQQDPNTAKKIHPNNRRRVLRALQLLRADLVLKPQNEGYLYDVLIIAFNSEREVLYSRINQRTEDMLTEGWITEAEKLQKMGYDLSKVNGIGYSDISDYLAGFISYNQLLEIIQQKTRRYAKRQLTWINNQLDAKIIEIDYQNLPLALDETTAIINEFLNN